MHFAVVAPVLHTYYTTHGMSKYGAEEYVSQKVLYKYFTVALISN